MMMMMMRMMMMVVMVVIMMVATCLSTREVAQVDILYSQYSCLKADKT